MYLVSSCDLKMNCVIEMQLALLSYWLSWCDGVTPPSWVELSVDGKTLMIDYEEYLVSLRISIFDSKL